MRRRRVRKWMGAGLASALVLAFAFYHHFRKPSAVPEAEGCVNQGQDHRMAASVICGAQQRLSWKSDHEPHFVLMGNPERTSVGLAWPPYLVYNSPAGDGRWRMFRIGFRYDRGWRGYIFPTIAWKLIAKPLRY